MDMLYFSTLGNALIYDEDILYLGIDIISIRLELPCLIYASIKKDCINVIIHSSEII